MSVTTFSNGIPILSILGTVTSTPSTYASLPWNGVSKPYQWICTLTITPQGQSGVNTRQKFSYNGQDVNVGQWIANVGTGLTWQIVSISSKTTTSVTCIIQDIFRYNTYRDPTHTGNGKPLAGSYVIYELSAGGVPMVDPMPAGIGANFFTTLAGRFAYINEEQFDFPLTQPGNMPVSFNPGDILAINPSTFTFVEANPTYEATIVGQVTAVDDNGYTFAINPIGKVIDNFNFLPGTIGQFLYAGTSTPGQLSTTPGGGQVYLTVRQWTASTTTSSTFGSPSTVVTTAGSTFNVNGILATVGGTGTLTDVENAVNAIQGSTGVSATITGSFYIQFTAVDARQIGFEDVSGSTTITAGLISAENGVKGAVIVVTSSTASVPAGLTHSYGYVFVQSSASTTWTITHNAGTTNVSAQIYNSFSGANAAGSIILPDEITIVDINNITVTFQAAQSGTALLTIFL